MPSFENTKRSTDLLQFQNNINNNLRKYVNKLLYKMDNNNCSSKNNRQSGFSLIEIMVAALILSIGILGVASLQLLGLKGTHQSTMKLQAMTIVQSLTERMHANKQGVAAGNYLIPDSSGFDCSDLPSCSDSTSTCTIAEIATVDLHNLICGYQAGSHPSTGGVRTSAPGDMQGLNNGQLNVTCPNAAGCASGDVQISVLWDERNFSSKEEEITLGTQSDSLVVNTRVIR